MLRNDSLRFITSESVRLRSLLSYYLMEISKYLALTLLCFIKNTFLQMYSILGSARYSESVRDSELFFSKIKSFLLYVKISGKQNKEQHSNKKQVLYEKGNLNIHIFLSIKRCWLFNLNEYHISRPKDKTHLSERQMTSNMVRTGSAEQFLYPDVRFT